MDLAESGLIRYVAIKERITEIFSEVRPLTVL